MAGKKTLLDFALDIYNMDRDQEDLRDRLIREWNSAIADPNPAEGLYMLFRLEGYDATYEECLKFWKTYEKVKDDPPWKQEQGGPMCY